MQPSSTATRVTRLRVQPFAQIAMKLEPQAYSPKELIMFVGEVATRMYVINRDFVARAW